MKLFLIWIIVAGCAPSLPDDLPVSSAASETSQPAPMHAPGVALQSDPPLPGEDASAWPGLSPAGPHDMSMGGMHHHMDGMEGGAHAP